MNEKEKLESSIKTIISVFDNPNREGLKSTPKRYAEALMEILRPVKEVDFTCFNSQGYDQMIISKNIKFYTLCEHHLLPFFGRVSIAYIPKRKIIGLSKLARLVEYYSKMLNTQEYFAQNIANKLQEVLRPQGLGVQVTGRHLCQEMRGIKAKGEMVTVALKGNFQIQKVKEEFFLNLK